MGAVQGSSRFSVFDNLSGMAVAGEEVLVEAFIARSRSIEALSTKPFCIWLAWRDVMPLDNMVPAAIWGWRIEVNSVPYLTRS